LGLSARAQKGSLNRLTNAHGANGKCSKRFGVLHDGRIFQAFDQMAPDLEARGGYEGEP
jgi:hypothetical protein